MNLHLPETTEQNQLEIDRRTIESMRKKIATGKLTPTEITAHQKYIDSIIERLGFDPTTPKNQAN
ncbi:MAG TPA: hypothetical protein VGA89_01310 [Patescibacteria group bacterium]|jgi:hypothetical protein